MALKRPYYSMFSAAGNRMVHGMVETAKKKLATKSRAVVVAYINKRVGEIQKGHGEVRDTAVRESIAEALDPAFISAGVNGLSIFEF